MSKKNVKKIKYILYTHHKAKLEIKLDRNYKFSKIINEDFEK